MSVVVIAVTMNPLIVALKCSLWRGGLVIQKLSSGYPVKETAPQRKRKDDSHGFQLEFPAGTLPGSPARTNLGHP